MKKALSFIFWLALTTWGVASVGVIQQFHGSVHVVRNTRTLPVTRRFKLEKADILRTGNNGWVRIRLNDNTRITVGKNAEMAIRDYLYNKSKQSKVTLWFSKGIFRTLSGAIGKVARKHFKVHTPTATIGIRGTEFYVRVSSEREQVLCTRGAIVFNNGQREILVDAGHQVLADLVSQRLEAGKISAKDLGSFQKSLGTSRKKSSTQKSKRTLKRTTQGSSKKKSRRKRSVGGENRTEELLHEQDISIGIDNAEPIVQYPCETIRP
jgi:hypothetical protein